MYSNSEKFSLPKTHKPPQQPVQMKKSSSEVSGGKELYPEFSVLDDIQKLKSIALINPKATFQIRKKK